MKTTTLAFVGVVVVALIGAGAFIVADQGPEEGQVTADFDGEFEQALIAEEDIESPFEAVNDFTTYTVDDTASDGTADVLDQAVAAWDLASGQELGLQEATAVLFFETDGAMEGADVEFEDVTSTYNVSLTEIEVFDYEAAEDADSLDAGTMAVEFEDVEGTAAEAELGQLEEGEYAILPTFKWDSGDTATDEALTNLTIEGDTDGDVDEIRDVEVKTAIQ